MRWARRTGRRGAMFRTASGQARVDVVTRTRHPPREAAARAALALARDNGWGRA